VANDPWEIIDGLTFYPWKGPDYERNSAVKIRILVMEETTHFGENKEAKEEYENLDEQDRASILRQTRDYDRHTAHHPLRHLFCDLPVALWRRSRNICA